MSGNKRPMFDIEDSVDVTLTENKTTADEVANVRRTSRFFAHRNEAGAGAKPTRFIDTFWGRLLVAVVAGVIVLAIAYYAGVQRYV